MKLLILLIFLSIGYQANANITSVCSNPDATVTYAQELIGNNLLVTFETANSAGLPQFTKKELTNFTHLQLSEQFLGETVSNTCEKSTATGTLSKQTLTFRKMVFMSADGKALPNGIVGLSEDGLSLPVDYLCKTTTTSPVKCP